MIHAIERWDLERSLTIGETVRAIDPDLAQPGWCWNSAVAVTLLLRREGAVYVEGWMHNLHPRAPHPRFPHAWTVLEDGSVIDTTSGATAVEDGVLRMAVYVFYEPVHEWPARDLFELIATEEPELPLTPEYDNWEEATDAEAL